VYGSLVLLNLVGQDEVLVWIYQFSEEKHKTMSHLGIIQKIRHNEKIEKKTSNPWELCITHLH